ncbi:MAG: putative toxin-antitoxin system toxin component, PIN family [Candidatus Methylomirabilales bacterium]
MIVAVIDTNVLISSAISDKGSPRKVFELWRDGRFILLSSPELIEEVGLVLRYPRIQSRYRLSESDILAFLQLLSTAATIVSAQPAPLEGLPDPSDAKLFLAARAGRAEYLVTGDQALLAMGDYQDIRVLPATAFVELVEERR